MDLMGLFFDVNRSNVKRHIDKLTSVLELTLGRTLSLPKRKISTVEEFLKIIPKAKDLFTDGTERPIQRPKSNGKQKENYSGKKKAHTKKNIIINDENRKVLYISPTKTGKTHDIAIFKDELDPSVIPRDVCFWLDKGFTGIDKDYPDLDFVMPKRKPRGKELTQEQKDDNKTISGIRILSEHAIAGIKRLRILTDKFRNKSEEFNDKVAYLACGLWNYHLTYC